MKRTSGASANPNPLQPVREGQRRVDDESTTSQVLEGAVGGHPASIPAQMRAIAIASAEEDINIEEMAERALLSLATEQGQSQEIVATLPATRNYSERVQFARELQNGRYHKKNH